MHVYNIRSPNPTSFPKSYMLAYVKTHTRTCTYSIVGNFGEHYDLGNDVGFGGILPTLVGSGRPQPPLSHFYHHSGLFYHHSQSVKSAEMLYLVQFDNTLAKVQPPLRLSWAEPCTCKTHYHYRHVHFLGRRLLHAHT